jgi:hypothetical protein
VFVGVDVREPAQLAADVIEAAAARDRSEARLLGLLAEVIRSNTFTSDGSTSAAMWLRRRVDLDAAEAGRLVHTAARLAWAPLVAAAVAAGHMSCRRAALLTRPLANARVREAFAAQEADLLAATAAMTAQGVARWAGVWEREHDEEAFGNAKVHVNRLRIHTDRWGRRVIHAVLEPVGGAMVEVELRGVAGQLRHAGGVQPEGEQLTGEVLLGAALVEMAARSSGNDKHNPQAPTVVVEISEDQLEEFLADHPDVTFDDDDDDDDDDGGREGGEQPSAREASGGEGCGYDGCVHDDIDHAAGDGDGGARCGGGDAANEGDDGRGHDARGGEASRGDGVGGSGAMWPAPGVDHGGGCCGGPGPRPATIDGQPITRSQLRRILCDSLLYALVVGSDGAILRLGRMERTATKEQRLLLALRDGSCVFPGCTMPAHRCRAHHIRWWRHGGLTDIEGLCLVCDQHHGEIHGHRWSVEQTGTGHTWTHLRTGRVEHRRFERRFSSEPPT